MLGLISGIHSLSYQHFPSVVARKGQMCKSWDTVGGKALDCNLLTPFGLVVRYQLSGEKHTSKLEASILF